MRGLDGSSLKITQNYPRPAEHRLLEVPIIQLAPDNTDNHSNYYFKGGVLRAFLVGEIPNSETDPKNSERVGLNEMAPSNYPLFLQILDYAEKLNLSDETKKSIANARNQILSWQVDPSKRAVVDQAAARRRGRTDMDKLAQIYGPLPIVQISIPPNPPIPITEFIAEQASTAPASTPISLKPPPAKPTPAVAQADISTFNTPILITLSVIVLAAIYWRLRRK